MPNDKPNRTANHSEALAAVAADLLTVFSSTSGLRARRGLHLAKPGVWRLTFRRAYCLVARRPNETEPFTAAHAAELLEWLRAAEWLDSTPHFGEYRGPGAETPAERKARQAAQKQAFEQLRPFLQHFGAITEMSWTRPRGLFQQSFAALAADQDFPSRGEITVLADELLALLQHLRVAIMVVVALHEATPTDALKVAEARLPEFFAEVRRSAPSASRDDADELAIHLIRSWFAAWVEVEQLTPALVLHDVGQPARVDLVPSSVIQFLWLTFAVTVGAIDMGIVVPGVHQCDYCGALFVADRSRVRGDHVFCSESHGKRFHARKRMQEKRAEERERNAAASRSRTSR